MTVTIPLRKGEVLLPKASTAWISNYKEIQTVHGHPFRGKTYWLVEMTSVTGNVYLETLSEDTLRSGFERKPTFYQMGKVYKFPRREDTWEILDLYQVTNPVWGDNAQKAIARMTDAETGEQDIQTLNKSDFERMVEVK